MKNRKGFALSGIIYSLLILFLVLVLNSLNNLQNKKQILDQLKLDTVNAIDQPWQVELANLQTQINNLNKKVIDLEQKEQYPIGSIYMSVKNENPSIKFGGTWVAWGNGKVPVGVDTNQSEFNTVEKTGGAKTHTLTVNEMPSHTHIQNAHFHYITSYDVFNPTWVFMANDHGGDNLVSSDNTDLSNTALGELKYNRYRTDDTVATNQNTGGSQPHNNLQPYITAYMWKRTA